MNDSDIKFLKTRINQKVQFHCKDGEVVVGIVHFVSDEEQDVVYDLVSSNRMSQYPWLQERAYSVPFEEIDFVTLPES